MIGAIIVGLLICALVIFSLYMNDNSTNDFYKGLWTGVITMILIVFEVNLLSNIIRKPTPSALDVYRGNTELEITSINGTPIDTVVVFKKKKIIKNKINLENK